MSYKAHFYEKDGKVFFHLESPSIADSAAIPFEFDGPATDNHKVHYAKQYEDFLANKATQKILVAEMLEASQPFEIGSEPLPVEPEVIRDEIESTIEIALSEN